MARKLIIPPKVEPLAFADVEAQIQSTLPDDQADLVGGFIVAVRQKCENELRRALLTQTWDLVLDSFLRPGARCPSWNAIEIPLPPLQSVVSVKYLSTANVLTTLAPTEYVVDLDSTPGRVMPAYGKTWPSTLDFPNAVRIQFVAGYGDEAEDVPQCIKNWMLLNVANLYENRESETVSTGRLTAVDLSTMADALLDPERWELRV
jgi:uncharacterized phiE125 gp8 family phage protein